MKPSLILWSEKGNDQIFDVLNKIVSKLVVFKDFNEGFEELKTNHYDIIMISGFQEESLKEFIQKLKKRHRNLPVIVHQKSYENRLRLIKLGVTDVIVDELFTKACLEHVFINSIHTADLERQKRESVFQLKKLESRLNTIMGNTPVILFILDLEGVFKMGVGRLWERFKVDKQFVLGQNLLDVYSDYPAFVDAYSHAQKGSVQSISITINNIIFEIILTPLFDNKGEVNEVLGLAHDVTERARSEMALLKSKKMAEDAATIKQEFIANMSHEIRTPMNAIVGFINLLEETKLNGTQRDYVLSVKIAGENLLSLINTILDFSRIESGQVNHEEEIFDLNHVVYSIEKVLMLKVQEKRLKFNYQIKKTVPIELLGDSNGLYQVLTNLLANSIKFTESGEVILSIDCLSVVDDTAIIEFKVKDTGIGIPEYMIKKVFDSFTQVNTGSNRKYGGTGLGLSIVKKIVEQLNGTIELKSELRKGSEFTVKIPFKIAKNILANNKKTLKAVGKLSLPKGLKILLAEDNVMNQKLVLIILKKFHVKVDLAETGVEVIKALKSNDYDVVLMDIQMPEMDGIEATKIIRKEFGDKKKNIPIIAMTAHAFQEELDKCLMVGMDAHVIKPIDTANFISTINECVSSKKREITIDLSYLNQLFENDKTIINQVIETFEWEIPEILNELDGAIKSSDLDHVAKMAHKAKASFKIFAMDSSVQALVQIESKSKAGDFQKLQELKDFVQSQFSLALKVLKSDKNNL